MSPVAIITGAGQGIGLAIALRLADDGHDIAINDLPSQQPAVEAAIKSIEAKGQKAIFIPGDVSSEDDVKAMIDKTVKELGSLDVMIANAGIFITKPIADFTMAEYDRMMAINSRGPALCFKYGAAQMIKQGRGGKILAASAIAGKKGFPNLAYYSMSKFAIRGLVQAFAQELRPHNIQVNAYAPGITATALFSGAQEAAKHDAGVTLQQRLGLPADTPVGKPEYIASLVSYLVKPEAIFINGQTLTADGGVVFD